MTAFSFAEIPELSGRTAIVTGSNTGIGLEIARHLARKGARVLLACRDSDKAAEAIADIKSGPEQADVEFLKLDLSNLASIRDAADKVRKERQIDLLINNAGVMTPPKTLVMGGTELQFATNHLGHFAFTALLLDKLAETPGSRVVTQASLAHRGAKIDFDNLDAAKGYSRTKFYGQSKLANLLFALELDRRLRAAKSPVASIAAHPGIAATELMRHMGPLKFFNPVLGFVLNTAEQGAIPALQAATDPAAQGGEYYGPYGLGEMSAAKSGRAAVTRTARDPELAARLWDVSVEMTGIDPELAPA